MQVLITGATRGIGKAVAEAFAQKENRLFLVARSLEQLQSLKKGLIEQYNLDDENVLVRSVDLSSVNETLHLTEAVRYAFGAPDVIVNNVGQYFPKALEDETYSDLKAQLAINLNPAYLVTQAFTKELKQKERAYIFNIGSIVTEKPRKEAASYTISKFALLGLHKVLVKALREHGVGVCMIIPGSVNTSSWDGIEAPKEKFVQPEDIANFIVSSTQLNPHTFAEKIVVEPKDPAL